MPNALDLAGQRFGRLLVISSAPARGPDRRWQCVCDCSKQCVTTTSRLRSGETSSCGCLHREVAGRQLRTHGASETLTWKRWRSMVARCTMVNAKNYPHYGGRGIRVCERWLHSFQNFRTDMGECPGPEYTTERKNNDGNYEPSNCRWATADEQKRNNSANRRLTFQGETLCAAEWGERLGINTRTIYTRLNKGWADEQVLSTPVRPQRPRRPAHA